MPPLVTRASPCREGPRLALGIVVGSLVSLNTFVGRYPNDRDLSAASPKGASSIMALAIATV